MPSIGPPCVNEYGWTTMTGVGVAVGTSVAIGGGVMVGVDVDGAVLVEVVVVAGNVGRVVMVAETRGVTDVLVEVGTLVGGSDGTGGAVIVTLQSQGEITWRLNVPGLLSWTVPRARFPRRFTSVA